MRIASVGSCSSCSSACALPMPELQSLTYSAWACLCISMVGTTSFMRLPLCLHIRPSMAASSTACDIRLTAASYRSDTPQSCSRRS